MNFNIIILNIYHKWKPGLYDALFAVSCIIIHCGIISYTTYQEFQFHRENLRAIPPFVELIPVHWKEIHVIAWIDYSYESHGGSCFQSHRNTEKRQRSGTKTASPWSLFGKQCHFEGWIRFFLHSMELNYAPWNGSRGTAVLAPHFFSVNVMFLDINESKVFTQINQLNEFSMLKSEPL